MLNIENILESPIITNPWQYQLVDNILTKESYDKILEGGKILAEAAAQEPRDPNGIWMHDAAKYGVPNDTINLIMDLNLQFLQNHNKVLARYQNAMNSKIGYFSIPRYNFIGPNVDGTIHDEGNNKTIAMVMYLSPEKTIGTRLYTEENYNSFVKEVEWKPNRAFIMCSQPGITWHSFHSDHQSRLTLNFYYEKMENMQYINNLGIEKINWFYNQFLEGKVLSIYDDR
jgi:hypothetical protein